MKEKIYGFIKTDSARVFVWMIALLGEFFLLRWVLNTITLTETQLYSIALIGAAFLFFSIFYWMREKQSTEGWIYCLLLFEFMLFRLNTKEEFERITHLEFRYLPWIVVGYIVFRSIFPFAKLSNIIVAFWGALNDIRNERAKEREKNRETIIEERKKRIEERKKRNQINRVHRQDRWKHVGNIVLTWKDGVKNSFSDIVIGLGSAESKQAPEQSDKEQDRIHFLKVLHRQTIFSIIIVLGLFVTVFVIALNITGSDLKSLLFPEDPTVEQVINKIIDVLFSVAFLIIVCSALIAIVTNIIFQVKRFVTDLCMDLLKDPGQRSLTTSVFFTLTAGVLIWWFEENHKIEVQDVASWMSSGKLIVYPLAFVLLMVIISFFTNNITEKEVISYIRQKKVFNIAISIFDLAIGSISAVVTYLKLVTADYLSSIVQLSLDEDITDDLEEENRDE